MTFNTAVLTDKLSRLASHPALTTRYLFISSLCIAITVPILARARSDYLGWLSLGKGGVPYNVFGWMLQSMLRPFAFRETRSLAPYSRADVIKMYEPTGRNRYIEGDLGFRAGDRPAVGPWVAPQRELEGNSEDVRKLQLREFSSIIASNIDVVEYQESRLENGGPAIMLKASIPLQPWVNRGLKNEIAHMHITTDGSSHVTLSLADAEEVIRKGWGERHKLSGKVLPWGYVILYAPRNEEEVAVLGQFFRAAIRFMSGGAFEIR